MANTCVNVWVGNRRKSALVIPTDEDGIARLQLTTKQGQADLSHRWNRCGRFGVINPVVPYADVLRINAGYVLCQYRKADHSWLAITEFSTRQLLQHGFVTKNTCGEATASPKPGEVTIFVRPLTWWEELRQ